VRVHGKAKGTDYKKPLTPFDPRVARVLFGLPEYPGWISFLFLMHSEHCPAFRRSKEVADELKTAEEAGYVPPPCVYSFFLNPT
jgi:hypothetical protein